MNNRADAYPKLPYTADMTSSTFHGNSPVQVYIGPELARYGFGQGHPFGPDRMDAF